MASQRRRQDARRARCEQRPAVQRRPPATPPAQRHASQHLQVGSRQQRRRQWKRKAAKPASNPLQALTQRGSGGGTMRQPCSKQVAGRRAS
eukprot:2594216-Alexandrium_andersonii.AAC.2